MFTKPFKQLTKKDVSIAGGKGASLGEMTRVGIPVPAGFVILASAFEQFIEETDVDMEIESELDKVNHKDINSVEEASERIRAVIAKVKIPRDIAKEIMREYGKLPLTLSLSHSFLMGEGKRVRPPSPAIIGACLPSRQAGEGKGARGLLVAVRSSATAEDSSSAAWAGQLETYLNTSEKDLLKNVQLCWSSLFTPRAIFYRFEQKLNKKPVSVAVVVQQMVQSEVAGICFTVHPVTKDRNQMVIEAGFGLGEAVVSGQVTPDTYVVHKDDFSLLDINVSEQSMMIVKGGCDNVHKKLSPKVGGKQKLTGQQIVALAKICAGIEKHYKKPQDIEWAWAGGKFYITQSRPITTL